MLYSKPKGMKYTDMAIYIDNNIYREDITEEEKVTCFKYMYLISYMLASKKKFFSRIEDYDNFAYVMAVKLFIRFICKDQFPSYDKSELSRYRDLIQDGRYKGRVKSVLNYAKAILYGTKWTWEKENYQQSFREDFSKFLPFDSTLLKENMRITVLQYQNFDVRREEYMDTFKEIPKLIKKSLNKYPFIDNDLLYNKLYISCLLTLKNNFLNNNKEPNILLWHLSEEYKDIVLFLCNKTKLYLQEELLSVQKYLNIPDEQVNWILDSNFDTKDEDYN